MYGPYVGGLGNLDAKEVVSYEEGIDLSEGV